MRSPGSELAKLRGEPPAGALPHKDPEAVRDALQRVRDGVRAGELLSAHDIAEGGIAVALAECCIAGGLGATVSLPPGLDPFGEDPGSAFLVSGSEAALAGLPIIGRTGGDALRIDGLLEIPVGELGAAHAAGLREVL
jgi:phosphoribosylformylglycinamidine (FGAM) synthase-like enzyme